MNSFRRSKGSTTLKEATEEVKRVLTWEKNLKLASLQF